MARTAQQLLLVLACLAALAQAALPLPPPGPAAVRLGPFLPPGGRPGQGATAGAPEAAHAPAPAEVVAPRRRRAVHRASTIPAEREPVLLHSSAGSLFVVAGARDVLLGAGALVFLAACHFLLY